jgi:cysteine desulfurase
VVSELQQLGDVPQRPIYLDYHATTPTDPRVADVVLHYLTRAFGNASSTDHVYGDEAEEAVATARAHVGAIVGSPARSVIFTSGATESINLALVGFAKARAESGAVGPVRIGVSPVEHRAVLDTCRILAEAGAARLRWLPVDHLGRVDLDAVEDVCRDGLDLLCLMTANNEVGTLYPVAAASGIAARHGVALFSDATQAVGKVPVRFSEWGVTFLALSAHKNYGPKGCGALIVAPDADLRPIIHGGGHQRGLRSGTLNVPGIAGLGEACRLRSLEMHADEPAIAARRDTLQRHLQDRIPELIVNGDLANRLSGNLHVSIPSVPNGAVVARLRHRVALSTGAACSSGIEAPSHVLQAMDLPQPVVEGALRISLGKFTTDEDIARAGELIVEAVQEVRRALAH